MLEPNLANHPGQRVGIFIDTQNLYHSAKSNYHSNVNYEEVIHTAVNGRKLIRAFAYVIKSEHTDEEKFFDALADIGIEIRVKDIQVFYTGEKKADWDVGIAVDMIRMTEKLDTVILVSGDGDFIEVIKYVKSRGVRAEIMAFKKTTSLKLVEEADFFYDLGSDPERFLINPRRVPKVLSRRLIAEKRSQTSAHISNNSSPSISPHSTNAPSFFQKKFSSSSTAVAQKSFTNVPSYLKSAVVTKKQEEILYGKKVKRNIKPVIGLPVKKNYGSRLKNQSASTSKASLENAFGNKRPMKKPQTNKPISSIFGNNF